MREYKKLMEAEAPHELHRAQGAVGILDVLLKLKDDIKSYEQDVRAGRVSPLKEG